MVLEDLAAYLYEQGLGRQGVDVFAHRMPENAARGALLTLPLTGVMIDHYMPGYFKSNFMVVIRHQKIDEGISRAKEISDALTLSEKQLATVMVKYIRPRHLPVPYPSSKGDNFEVSVGFDASYYLL